MVRVQWDPVQDLWSLLCSLMTGNQIFMQVGGSCSSGPDHISSIMLHPMLLQVAVSPNYYDKLRLQWARKTLDPGCPAAGLGWDSLISSEIISNVVDLWFLVLWSMTMRCLVTSSFWAVLGFSGIAAREQLLGNSWGSKCLWRPRD